MIDKIYSITKEALTEFQTKMKTWVRSVTPTKTSDLDNDSDFLDQLALAGIVASNFSTSSTYEIGDYVLYNHTLYRCTTAISSAGDWDSSKWTATKTQDIFSGSAPGLVPAAESGDADKVLKGDGTWGEVEAGSSVRISYDSVTEELHMDFSPPLPPNKVRVDGIVYDTKVLGTQEWMIQNLRSPIGTLDVDYKIRNSENIEYDGLYYNMSALFDSDGSVKSDVLDMIPSGWRIPTASDMGKLQSFGSSGNHYYWYQNRSDYEVIGFNATESGAYIVGSWNDPTYLFQMWIQGFINDDPRLNKFIEMSYKDSTWTANNWIQLEWNPYFVVRLVRDVT